MKLLKQVFAMLFAIGAYFSPLALDAMKGPHQIGNPNARLKMTAQAKLGKNQIPPIKAPKKIGKPEAREGKKFSNRQWVGKKKVVLPVGQGERIVIEEEKLEAPTVSKVTSPKQKKIDKGFDVYGLNALFNENNSEEEPSANVNQEEPAMEEVSATSAEKTAIPESNAPAVAVRQAPSSEIPAPPAPPAPPIKRVA